MNERTCIHPFIKQTQKSFMEGKSLSEVFGSIRSYQQKVNSLITDISPKARIPHLIGVSIMGLGVITLYEYARAHGFPLRDMSDLLDIAPFASFTPSDGLTDEQRKWANDLRASRDLTPLNRRLDDAHRSHAHGVIDEKLEAGSISPKEANQRKKNWDNRHGY